MQCFCRYVSTAVILCVQVSDQELEAIARGEGAAAMDIDTDGAGGDATRRLLGDYQTPARCAQIIYRDVLLLQRDVPSCQLHFQAVFLV